MNSGEYEARGGIIPIHIRDGAPPVKIHGIPHDLSAVEAEKIAAVILALTTSSNRARDAARNEIA